MSVTLTAPGKRLSSSDGATSRKHVVALTPRQERFVEEYLVDLNATQAAIRAGYKSQYADRYAHQLLEKNGVKAAIDELKAARSERTNLTAEMVIKGLLAEAEFHGEGSSHSARVQAWQHLGKHLGIFIDKKEVTGTMAVIDIVRRVVDAREEIEEDS